MADQEAAVTLGSKGADKIIADARRVQDAWQRAGEGVASSVKRAGSEIGSQFTQIGTDALRTVTVMRTLDMKSAVDGARDYREEVTRFSTQAQLSFGTAKTGIENLSKATLESESKVLAWSKAVGRLTYDYTGAAMSAKALHDESVATGKSFDEMGHFGAMLHNSLGVKGEEVAGVLGLIRSQADALGTVGGVAALQDQIQALSGSLGDMNAGIGESRNRMLALIGVLGQGYRPDQAKGIQSSVMGFVTQSSALLQFTSGMDIYNDKGEVDAGKMPAALRELQKKYRRLIPNKKLRMLALQGAMGGNRMAAAAFERGDFTDEHLGAVAGLAPSTGAAKAASGFAESEAGQSLANQQTAQRNMRNALEPLLQAQDKYGAAFAGSPMAGQLIGSVLQASMGAGMKGLGGLFSGGAGGAVGGAGGAAGAAGGVASEEAATVALAGGLSSAAIAVGAFGLAVAATGKVLIDLGEASKAKMGFGPAPELTKAEAEEKAAAAKRAADEAKGHRTEGMQAAFEAEQKRLGKGDYSLEKQKQRAMEIVEAYGSGKGVQGIGSDTYRATGGDKALIELQSELSSGKGASLAELSKVFPAETARAIVAALAQTTLKVQPQPTPGPVPAGAQVQ